MVFITLLSLFSFPEDTIDLGVRIPNIDKLVHFGFYFMMVILGCFFLREIANHRIGLVKAILSMTVFAIVYGMILEVLQHTITTERSGDIWDFLANSAGALVGGILIKWVFYKKRRLKWKN